MNNSNFSPTSSFSSIESNASYPSPDKEELKRMLYEKDVKLKEFNQVLEKSRSLIFSFKNMEKEKSVDNSFVSPKRTSTRVDQSSSNDSFSDLELPVSQATSAFASPILSRSEAVRDMYLKHEQQVLEKNYTEQITALQHEIQKVNLQYAVITSELADKNEEIRSLKRQIDQLLLENSQKDDFITIMKENQVNEASDQAKLIKEIQDRNLQIANQQKLVSKHEETIQKLNDQINYKEEDARVLRDEITKLRKGDDSKLSEFYRQSLNIQFQQRELEYEKQITYLKNQVSSLRAENEDLNDSVKERENDIKQKYFEELTSIRKEAMKQVEENSMLREELRELKEIHARVMSEHETTTIQNGQYSSNYQKLEKNLSEMNELYTTTQRELQQSEQRVERLLSENMALQKQKTELEITYIPKQIYEDLKKDYLFSIEKIQKNFKNLLESLQTDTSLSNKDISQIKLQFMKEISDLQNLFLEELTVMKNHFGFASFDNIASDEQLLLSKRNQELHQKVDQLKIENMQLKEKLAQSKTSENSTVLVSEITRLLSSHTSIQQLISEITRVYEIVPKEGTFNEIRKRVLQKHNDKMMRLTDSLAEEVYKQVENTKEFDLNMCKKLVAQFSNTISEKFLPFATSIVAELSAVQLIDDRTLIKTEFQKYEKIEASMKKIEQWYDELIFIIVVEFRKLVTASKKVYTINESGLQTLNTNASFVEIKTLVELLDKDMRQVTEIDKQHALSFIKQFKHLYSREVALRSDIANLPHEKLEVDSILERERIVQRELDITNAFFTHIVVLIEKMSKTDISHENRSSNSKLERYKAKRNEFDKLLLQKIHKRIYTLKIVLNKEDESLLNDSTTQSDSISESSEKKKLSVQIGDAFNKLKAITKTIVKKYNLLYEQNRKIQDEILSLNTNKTFLKADKSTPIASKSLQNNSIPKVHEEIVSDLCILLMVEPNQLVDHVRKISKQSEMYSRMLQFCTVVNQLISNKNVISESPKLGNILVEYRDVINLDYLIEKVRDVTKEALLAEYLKNFFNSAKKEIAKFSKHSSDDVDTSTNTLTKIILSLKMQIQTISNILDNNQLNIEPLPLTQNAKEIVEYVKGLLGLENVDAIKTKLNQLYFNVHDRTEKQQEQERTNLKYLELTSKLKTILNVDSIQEIVSETRRVVLQLSKYVEQFPKFQKMLQQICRILQVQKVGEIMPAVQKLMKDQLQLKSVNQFFNPKSGSEAFADGKREDHSSIERLSVDELVDLIM